MSRGYKSLILAATALRTISKQLYLFFKTLAEDQKMLSAMMRIVASPVVCGEKVRQPSRVILVITSI